MSNTNDSNPILQSATDWMFAPYSTEVGLEHVVQGIDSHKCPVYVKRVPPCTNSCPAGEDIRGYHNILKGTQESDKPFEDAFMVAVDRNPFPAVMGRVCPAPCEGGCNRQYHDETVGINSVEHVLGEYAIENNLALHPAGPDSGKHVAVVGAGPAGLSAAYQLRRKGHKVTIYEAREKTGGMMRYGIMGYRVDREVLDKEVQRILDLDVEMKMGVAVGKDITLDELESGHDAVFIGVGAQLGRGLPVPGFDGTIYAKSAIDFLIDFEAQGNDVVVGKKVVVIGDGDVAMDVARLSLRLGSEATLLSAVPREEMNCTGYEFEEADAEGTKFEYQVSVTEVLRDGDKITGVKIVKMQKKEKGEEGFNSPIPFLRYKPIEGSEKIIECDMVVSSIGQATDMSGFEKLTDGKPFFKVDHHCLVKGQSKVFAGGDAIKIDLITTAVGHGRIAAEAIDTILQGSELGSKPRFEVAVNDRMHTYYFPASNKVQRKHIKIDVVKDNYTEILQALSQEEATGESERCMSCGLCFACKQCVKYCPQEAIEFRKKNPVGEKVYTEYKKCTGCHICAEVCPCGYIDMAMGEDL